MSDARKIFDRWYVYRDEDRRAIAVSRFAKGPNGGTVGRAVAHKPASMSFDDWNAVAHLVAAAPELLKVLKVVSGLDISPIVLHAVDAAIARAEGRAP